MVQLSCDAAVIGAGPAGLTAAVALASQGLETACIGPPAPTQTTPMPKAAMTAGADTRTTALLHASVQFLKNLGIWPHCAAEAAPLEAIRMIDDTGRLLRAPDVTFTAVELDVSAFGYNIANTSLVAALEHRAADLASLHRVATATASAVRPAPDQVEIQLGDGGTIAAGLAVGADGRKSLCRQAAEIETTSWSYPQVAIACNFEHTVPHDNVCTELHREAGPLTAVPLPGRASSLVWVETPEEAERLMALDDEAFARTLDDRLHGLLGTVSGIGPRGAFPLSGLTARRFADRRIALVGEAAHVIPPIGAQGLNLGFRDAAVLAEHVAEAAADGRDIGARALLQAYDRARRQDVLTRTAAVDLLNRSLISDVLPLQLARGLGLFAMNAVPPLRRFVMRQGMAPERHIPALMR